MDSSIKNEVLNDFKTALKSIDFSSYNPNSSEFLTALNLGLMWNILCEMSGDAESPALASDHKSVDEIDEELSGARKYLQKFSETQDAVFKEMANDELKHASILIKKAYSKLPSGEEKSRLKSYEDEIKVISEMM